MNGEEKSPRLAERTVELDTGVGAGIRIVDGSASDVVLVSSMVLIVVVGKVSDSLEVGIEVVDDVGVGAVDEVVSLSVSKVDVEVEEEVVVSESDSVWVPGERVDVGDSEGEVDNVGGAGGSLSVALGEGVSSGLVPNDEDSGWVGLELVVVGVDVSVIVETPDAMVEEGSPSVSVMVVEEGMVDV